MGFPGEARRPAAAKGNEKYGKNRESGVGDPRGVDEETDGRGQEGAGADPKEEKRSGGQFEYKKDHRNENPPNRRMHESAPRHRLISRKARPKIVYFLESMYSIRSTTRLE